MYFWYIHYNVYIKMLEGFLCSNSGCMFALSPQLYKLNIHNVVSEFVPLIMNTIMLQVSPQAR